MLETFEYFCQISSKSITIILSYTVSKLVHFLRHNVYCQPNSPTIILAGLMNRKVLC